MTPPDISLIVNTFEKPRHLALVLESIALQTGVDGRFEVVVADDGSGVDTRTIVAEFARRVPFPVAFTTEPHDGFRLARVRNRGAALAGGDTLLGRRRKRQHVGRLVLAAVLAVQATAFGAAHDAQAHGGVLLD